jgi:hypothetical protein
MSSAYAILAASMSVSPPLSPEGIIICHILLDFIMLHDIVNISLV